MPGAGAGRSHFPHADALHNPHDKALFFQAPPPTPPRPLSNKRSYDLHDKQTAHRSAPPPVPPLPPNYFSSEPNYPGPVRSAPAHVITHVVPRLPPKIPVSRSESGHSTATTAPPGHDAPVRVGHSRHVSVSSVEMEKALAMSLAEVDRSNLNSTQEQEDLELERALKESLSMSGSTEERVPGRNSNNTQSRLSLDTTMNTVPSGDSKSSLVITTSPTSTTFTTLSTGSRSQSPSKERHQALITGSSGNASRIALQEEEELRRRQMEEDERMARMLSEEAPPHSVPPSSRTAPPSPVNDRPPLSSLPRYEDAVRESARPRGSSPGLSRGSSSCIANVGASQNSPPLPNGPPTANTRMAHGVGAVGLSGRSISAHPIPSSHDGQTSRPGPTPLPHGARANSAPAPGARKPQAQLRLETVVEQGGLPNAPLTTQQSPFPSRVDSLAGGSPPAAVIADTSEVDEGRPRSSSQSSSESASTPAPSRPMVPIEDELLMGVCECFPLRYMTSLLIILSAFGFNAPSLTTGRAVMQGALPNIISLPYGKCPPLHIQAPTWRQLLILLTRMSESRIEPTVEAVAATKTELKLRTVVQFVKVCPSV